MYRLKAPKISLKMSRLGMSKTFLIRSCLISYNISHIFDRVLSTLFKPRFLARLRVAVLFALAMVVPPLPIALLETLGF